MKGKPYRLEGKISSTEIKKICNISNASFYNYLKKGFFGNLIKRDPISKNYYAEPEDLGKIKKMWKKL